jgi:hypothetical protein
MKALRCRGSATGTDFISYGDICDANVAAWTCWAQVIWWGSVSGTGNSGDITGKWQNSADRAWLLYNGGSGIWRFDILNSVSSGVGVDAPGVAGQIRRGEIVGVAAQINGSTTMYCYANGARSAGVATGGTGVKNSTAAWSIGGRIDNSGWNFSGLILQVACWTAFLTVDELQALDAGVPANMIRRGNLTEWVHYGDGVQKGRVTGASPTKSGRVILDDWPDDYQFPASTASAGVAPVNTVAPVVSGTPEVGQTLSVTDGTWTGVPAPTFTYQWQYNDGSWNNIVGATSATWVVDVSGAVDVGDTIRCQVTGSNASGNSTANSNATAALTGIDFTNQYLGVSVS